MATQRSSITTKTLTYVKQDEQIKQPTDANLKSAIDVALRNDRRSLEVFDAHGKFAGLKWYDFTSCTKVSAPVLHPGPPYCRGKKGNATFVGENTETDPLCCPPCDKQQKVRKGSEEWQEPPAVTDSNTSCRFNVNYEATFTLRPGQNPLNIYLTDRRGVFLPATIQWKGMATLLVSTVKQVIDHIKEVKSDSEPCTDCYC